MNNISELLLKIGLESEKLIMVLTTIITIALAGLGAWLVYMIAKKWLATLVHKLTKKTSAKWDDLLFDQKFFNHLGLLLVPIVLIIGISSLDGKFITVLNKLLNVWITFAAVNVLTSIMHGANRVYESFPVSKDRPITIFIQIIKIFLYVVAIIITISIFTGKDPIVLIGGMAVLASIIMLIFKDTILGFVAGIQLSANNMLRIGDWIEMPSARADGDVQEVGLVSVKVQNWDKTITTIPTYKLVSESFTNWRGMEESKGRRIKRSINIDVNSIRYLENDDLEKLKKSTLLKEYIEQKQQEIQEYNEKHPSEFDERRLTNIGTFREYMEAWLASNPSINLDMTHMVRQLQPGPTGIPLEVYCFSAHQQWVKYERVQADIFDHMYAVMELFGLQAFQYPGTQKSDSSVFIPEMHNIS